MTDQQKTDNQLMHNFMDSLIIPAIRDLDEQIATLQRRRVELAAELPLVTLDEVCSDGCNIEDRTFRSDLSRFMDRYMDSLDVTDLAGYEEVEAWTLNAGGGEYYTVVESKRWAVLDNDGDEAEVFETKEEALESAEEAFPGEAARFVRLSEDAQGFDIIEEDGSVYEHHDDEEEAQEEADQLNRQLTMDNLTGFPFAWNTGWEPDRCIAEEDLASSGFLVYTYDFDDVRKTIAGIDGAGYSFEGHHFCQLYLRTAARRGWTVETQYGPRKVEWK